MIRRLAVHDLRRFPVGFRFAPQGWRPDCFYRIVEACELDDPPPECAHIAVELVVRGRPHSRSWLTARGGRYVPVRGF